MFHNDTPCPKQPLWDKIDMEQDAAKTNATLETQYNYLTTYPPLSQTATLRQGPHGTRRS